MYHIDLPTTVTGKSGTGGGDCCAKEHINVVVNTASCRASSPDVRSGGSTPQPRRTPPRRTLTSGSLLPGSGGVMWTRGAPALPPCQRLWCPHARATGGSTPNDDGAPDGGALPTSGHGAAVNLLTTSVKTSAGMVTVEVSLTPRCTPSRPMSPCVNNVPLSVTGASGLACFGAGDGVFSGTCDTGTTVSSTVYTNSGSRGVPSALSSVSVSPSSVARRPTGEHATAALLQRRAEGWSSLLSCRYGVRPQSPIPDRVSH